MTEYGPYDKLPPFYENTVIELDVPSGKIVTADSLCCIDYFDVEPELSINYGRGCDQWAKQYAERGVGYAFVGNTCPEIIRRPDGVLEVVTGGWDEEADEEIPAILEGGEIVANICTDLWATMITDYQNWLDNGGPDPDTIDNNHKQYSVIEVIPGKYRWTVFSHNDNFDTWAQGRSVFAELELIQPYLPSSEEFNEK